MTRRELLELQSGLIERLTDWGASGKSLQHRPWMPERLAGIDHGVFELIAVLALGKRIDKILKVLPKTVSYFESHVKDVATEFAARHPPLRADSYFNACQFYGFLRRRWHRRPPDPPFLPDLAYAELAVIGVDRRAIVGSVPLLASYSRMVPFRIRRHPAVHMRRFDYDIRPLLGGSVGPDDISRHPVHVIISRPVDGGNPGVFQVDQGLFEVLRRLGPWTVQTPDQFQSNPQILSLYRQMESFGFIEVRLCELD